jgi:hypothetical protein
LQGRIHDRATLTHDHERERRTSATDQRHPQQPHSPHRHHGHGALIGNFLGTRSDKLGHIDLRIAIVTLAIITTIGLYREAFRKRTRRREDTPPEQPSANNQNTSLGRDFH